MCVCLRERERERERDDTFSSERQHVHAIVSCFDKFIREAQKNDLLLLWSLISLSMNSAQIWWWQYMFRTDSHIVSSKFHNSFHGCYSDDKGDVFSSHERKGDWVVCDAQNNVYSHKTHSQWSFQQIELQRTWEAKTKQIEKKQSLLVEKRTLHSFHTLSLCVREHWDALALDGGGMNYQLQ
jgi:hypothetical protein